MSRFADPPAPIDPPRFDQDAGADRPFRTGKRISMRQLKLLLHRVGSSLRAGVDARRIWQQESQRGPLGNRPALAEIARLISQGDSLASALAATRPFFPPLVCEMVEVGESTGRLDDVLLRLSEHYEHLLDMRRSFLMGIAWPAIQFTVAVLLVGLLIAIFGWIGARNDMTGEPIDPLGFGLTGTSGVVIYFGMILFVVSVLAFVAIAFRQGWMGTGPSQLLMRIPVIGKALETGAMARLAWTLSIALDSGLEARRSLRLALRSTQLAYYTQLERSADEVLQRGGEFHEALRVGGRIPDEFLDSLESAEHAGQAAESLEILSRDYTERSRMANRALTVGATFVTWGGVAALIIFLIFRLAMFYVGTINDALNFKI